MLILLLFLACFPAGSYRQPRCHGLDQYSSNICIHDYAEIHSELSESSIRFLFLFFQIQDGSWHESHFFFHTQDSRQLPIVDIQTFPAPRPSSQRHIEISPVCFFWHWHLVTLLVWIQLWCKAAKWPPTKAQASECGDPNGTQRKAATVKGCWCQLIIV